MGARQVMQLQYSKPRAMALDNAGTMPETEPELQSIYLYTHWGGEDDVNRCELAEAVRGAIRYCKETGDDRTDDETYFARMIVSRLFANDLTNTTGYGIGPNPDEFEEEYPRVVVDLAAKTVNGIAYEKFYSLYE